MKNIVIGFSKPKDKILPWFSWAIRLFEQTPYSHVYLHIALPGIDEVMTFQASGLSVNIVGKEYFNAKEQPVYEYEMIGELSDENHKKLLNFCFANSGKPYGVMEILHIMWSKIFKIKAQKETINQTSWVCSEIIAALLENVLDSGMTIDFTQAMPKDVYNFVSSSPLFKQIL